MTDARTHIALRVKPNALAWVDQIAEKTSTDRSKVIRAALSVASRHERDLIERLKAAD